MHGVVPFRGGGSGWAPTAAGPNLTTSIYETHLGLAALSWSRTVLGLSLRVNLRLSSGLGPALEGDGEGDEQHHLRFRVRPWLLWKRRGSKRFQCDGGAAVDVVWDLRRARFPHGGGPEPASGFFVSIAVDGEMALVAGDLVDEAYRKSKSSKPLWPPTLITRCEHVLLPDSPTGRSYTTTAHLGGRDRKISIDLCDRDRDGGMYLGVDGERVLTVRRIRWMFRGSEKVDLDGGASKIHLSWDLHNWLFHSTTTSSGPPSGPPTAAADETGRAVFVFRFEGEGYSGKNKEKKLEDVDIYKGIGEYFGKSRDCSESSSCGGGGEKRRGRRRRGLLRKTASSSSSTASTTSTASSTAVMEWASPEEAELRSADGFSLLVYAWKS